MIKLANNQVIKITERVINMKKYIMLDTQNLTKDHRSYYSKEIFTIPKEKVREVIEELRGFIG